MIHREDAEDTEGFFHRRGAEAQSELALLEAGFQGTSVGSPQLTTGH